MKFNIADSLSDSALFWCITVLIILFYGEPDIQDAIIHWLMRQ